MDSLDSSTFLNTPMPESWMRTSRRIPPVDLLHQDYITGSALCVPPDECRIHRLPFDLLSPIFRMLCNENAPSKEALHYSRVCRLWRETFENTTAFWTHIHIGNVDLAHLCIERSRQAPLSFTIEQLQRRESHAGRPPTYAFDQLPAAGVFLLRENMEYVHDLTLHITAEASVYVLPLLAALKMPHLTSFTLCDVSAPDHLDDEDIYEHAADALIFTSSTIDPEHIKCHNILPLDPATFYWRLTHLDITLTRQPINMTNWPVTTFFHIAPMLQYLRIEVDHSDLLAMDWRGPSDSTDVLIAEDMDITSDDLAPPPANHALTDITLSVPSVEDVVDVFEDMNVQTLPLKRVHLYIACDQDIVYMPDVLKALPNELLEAMRTSMVMLTLKYVEMTVSGRDCEVTLRMPRVAANGQAGEAMAELVWNVERVFPLLEYHCIVSGDLG